MTSLSPIGQLPCWLGHRKAWCCQDIADFWDCLRSCPVTWFLHVKKQRERSKWLKLRLWHSRYQVWCAALTTFILRNIACKAKDIISICEPNIQECSVSMSPQNLYCVQLHRQSSPCCWLMVEVVVMLVVWQFSWAKHVLILSFFKTNISSAQIMS